MSEERNNLLDSETLKQLSEVSPYRTLMFLAIDYISVALVSSTVLGLSVLARREGIHWAFQIPVWGIGIFLNGCIAHRIALAGHEAAHGLLVPNRKWNDILGNLLCFYPVFGTIDNYRKKHFLHHRYPNDPKLDPNLGGKTYEDHYRHFPMPHRTALQRYLVGFFWPPFVLRHLYGLLRSVTFSNCEELTKAHRWVMALGLIYFAVLSVGARISIHFTTPIAIPCIILFATGLIVWLLLPSRCFAPASLGEIPPKSNALLRMSYYTLWYGFLVYLSVHGKYDFSFAYIILWVVPVIYLFPYLMLIRDLLQHASSGDGEFDNSRIIRAPRLVRWALLGYGNDLHILHHLFPAIPHFRLPELRSRLATLDAPLEELHIGDQT